MLETTDLQYRLDNCSRLEDAIAILVAEQRGSFQVAWDNYSESVLFIATTFRGGRHVASQQRGSRLQFDVTRYPGSLVKEIGLQTVRGVAGPIDTAPPPP